MIDGGGMSLVRFLTEASDLVSGIIYFVSNDLLKEVELANDGAVMEAMVERRSGHVLADDDA